MKKNETFLAKKCLITGKENASLILGGFVNESSIVYNNPQCSVSCTRQRNA